MMGIIYEYAKKLVFYKMMWTLLISNLKKNHTFLIENFRRKLGD